jgi:dolichol-phosphate mannosyltransferase
MEKKVSFVIPTFNEAGCIKRTLMSFLALKIKNEKEIIVVDDNSSDKTAAIVESITSKKHNIKLIVRKDRRGFGSALVDGTNAAAGEYIIWTMADGCDELSAIPKMISRLDRGYDLVVASRNVKGGDRGDQPVIKSICSWSFCKLLGIFLRVGIKDSTNAFRGFRKSILSKIDLKANDFSISPEMILKAKRAGFKIGEVPVKYKERIKGQTKFRLWKMGRSFLGVVGRHVVGK